MKLSEILKKVGSAVIKETVPGGGMIVAAVNELLPDSMPKDATGDQLSNAIHAQPPAIRAALLSRQFEVEAETLQTMLTAEATSEHTTRPYIAKLSAQVVAFVVVTVILMWAYAVLRQNDTLVSAIVAGWPLILAAITPLTVLLRAYFGVLKHEHRNKLDASNGNPTASILGGLVSMLARK